MVLRIQYFKKAPHLRTRTLYTISDTHQQSVRIIYLDLCSTLWQFTSLLLKMAIQFVDLPPFSVKVYDSYTHISGFTHDQHMVIKHGSGKSPMNGGLIKKITYKWSIFQHAMFDKTGGQLPWSPATCDISPFAEALRRACDVHSILLRNGAKRTSPDLVDIQIWSYIYIIL